MRRRNEDGIGQAFDRHADALDTDALDRVRAPHRGKSHLSTGDTDPNITPD
jgi:hypothetical protein